MRARTAALAIAVLAGTVFAGYLYRENRRLRSDLASRPEATATQSAAAQVSDTPTAAESAQASRAAGTGGLRRALELLTIRLLPQRKRTWHEQRVEDQELLASLLGRRPGESPEEYRARMVPFLLSLLEQPRERMEQWRNRAEKAARVSREQREQMDAIVRDAHADAMALMNQAIAAGDLTPYERNAAGALTVVGGLGAILTATENQLAGVLTDGQQQTMRNTGFDWAEYMALGTPWEDLDAPPPPPGGG